MLTLLLVWARLAAVVPALVLLEVPSPTATPVYDTQPDGFAAAIVPAFVILGILVAAAVWTSRRPRSTRRRR